MTYGEQFRRYRKSAGLTQEQASEIVGVERNTVARWENERRTPRHEVLREHYLEKMREKAEKK